LVLDENPKRDAYSDGNHLSRFGIQVAAESLEVGAEQDNVPPHVLFVEERVGGSQCLGCGTLGIDFVQAGQAIVPPML
jgi:hypothetical protein